MKFMGYSVVLVKNGPSLVIAFLLLLFKTGKPSHISFGHFSLFYDLPEETLQLVSDGGQGKMVLVPFVPDYELSL